MKFEEVDEAEVARKKKESIAWRNKKRTTSLFTFAMSIVEIIVTLLVILGLFLLSAKIIFSFGQDQLQQKIFFATCVVVFFGGMFIGFVLYKIIARASIKWFKLEDKLTDEALSHFKKQTKEEKEASLRK